MLSLFSLFSLFALFSLFPLLSLLLLLALLLLPLLHSALLLLALTDFVRLCCHRDRFLCGPDNLMGRILYLHRPAAVTVTLLLSVIAAISITAAVASLRRALS